MTDQDKRALAYSLGYAALAEGPPTAQRGYPASMFRNPVCASRRPAGLASGSDLDKSCLDVGKRSPRLLPEVPAFLNGGNEVSRWNALYKSRADLNFGNTGMSTSFPRPYGARKPRSIFWYVNMDTGNIGKCSALIFTAGRNAHAEQA
jgi:hypothetical protein